MAYNNAGSVGPTCPMMDEPAAGFDEVVAVDLCGVWTCIKHELRQMTKQGHGSIVNCSSLGGLIGLPGRDACHATKHDVTGLTRSAALTMKQFLRTSRSAGLAVRRNRRDRSFGSAVFPPASF